MTTTKTAEFIEIFDLLQSANPSIRVEHSVTEIAGDPVAEVIPSDPDCAPIHASLDPDFGVYLRLGVGSVFEIPFNRGYYTQQGWKEETTLFCEAVAAGRFSEDLFRFLGKACGGKAHITIGVGRRIVERWGCHIFLPFWKGTTHIAYKPY